MYKYYLVKVIAAIRAKVFCLFFKYSGSLNYIYSFVSINSFSRVSLGKNNVISKFVTIYTDIFKDGAFISIGNNCVLSSYVVLKSYTKELNIGDNVFLGERVQIQSFGRVKISNNVMIAGNTFITSSNHDFSKPNSDDYLKGEVPEDVYIGNSTWIGANCTITAGVRIGEFSVIGAGSVVTSDIPAYSVAVGVPARVIKTFDKSVQEWKYV